MLAAEKTQLRARPSRLLLASRTCPEPWAGNLRRVRLLWPSPIAAFFSEPSRRQEFQWMVSSGLWNPLKSSSSSTAFSAPGSLPASSSLISNTGSDTTYFSVAQLPRSRSRQRSLQKGKSALSAESVGVLQMGQRCFIGNDSRRLVTRLSPNHQAGIYFFSVNSARSVLKSRFNIGATETAEQNS